MGIEIRRLRPGDEGPRGIAEGFVITNASNEPATALYDSVGGARPAPDDVVWELLWSRAS